MASRITETRALGEDCITSQSAQHTRHGVNAQQSAGTAPCCSILRLGSLGLQVSLPLTAPIWEAPPVAALQRANSGVAAAEAVRGSHELVASSQQRCSDALAD